MQRLTASVHRYGRGADRHAAASAAHRAAAAAAHRAGPQVKETEKEDRGSQQHTHGKCAP